MSDAAERLLVQLRSVGYEVRRSGIRPEPPADVSAVVNPLLADASSILERRDRTAAALIDGADGSGLGVWADGDRLRIGVLERPRSGREWTDEELEAAARGLDAQLGLLRDYYLDALAECRRRGRTSPPDDLLEEWAW